MKQVTRYAANEIILNGQKLLMHVIEIVDGNVVNFYPLIGEPPFTIWIQGTIRVVDKGGWLKAYYGNKILE